MSVPPCSRGRTRASVASAASCRVQRADTGWVGSCGSSDHMDWLARQLARRPTAAPKWQRRQPTAPGSICPPAQPNPSPNPNALLAVVWADGRLGAAALVLIRRCHLNFINGMAHRRLPWQLGQLLDVDAVHVRILGKQLRQRRVFGGGVGGSAVQHCGQTAAQMGGWVSGWVGAGGHSRGHTSILGKQLQGVEGEGGMGSIAGSRRAVSDCKCNRMQPLRTGELSCCLVEPPRPASKHTRIPTPPPTPDHQPAWA